MATITWRNVDAPSFRDSLDAYRLSAETLAAGIQSAKGGLKEFEDSQIRQESNAFMADLLSRYQNNPDALTAALADGSALAGVDTNRLNPDALALLRERPRDLQMMEKGAADIDQTTVQTMGMRDTNEYTNWARGEAKEDRTFVEADRDAGIAVRPIAANFQSLLGAGTPEAEAQARAYLATPEVQGALSKLPVADQIALRTAGSAQIASILGNVMSRETIAMQPILREGARLNNAGQAIQNATGEFGLEVAREDRTAQDEAFAAAQIALSAAPDADTARGILMSAGLKGRAFNNALALMEGRFPGLVGSISQQAESSGSVDTGASNRVMNYEARAAGFNSVPADVKTLGQASDFALKVNRAGADSSAMGTFQITGDTMRDFAPRLFGKDWRSKDFTPEVQDQMAEAIFKSSRGSASALRNRWVSLSLGEAERVRKMPWEQARAIIAKKESGANLTASATPRLGANPAQAQQITVALRQGQNAVNSIGSRWLAASDKADVPITTVVDQLRAGSFKGVSPEFLTREVRQVMQRTGGNATQAADILRNSVTDSGQGTFGRIGRRLYNGTIGQIGEQYNPTLPGGKRISEELVNQQVRQVRSGDIEPAAVEQARLGNIQGLIVSAQTNFQAVDAQYKQALAALQRGDQRQNTILPRLERNRNTAYQRVIMLEKQLGSESEESSRFRKPGSYRVGGVEGLATVRSAR